MFSFFFYGEGVIMRSWNIQIIGTRWRWWKWLLAYFGFGTVFFLQFKTPHLLPCPKSKLQVTWNYMYSINRMMNYKSHVMPWRKRNPNCHAQVHMFRDCWYEASWGNDLANLHISQTPLWAGKFTMCHITAQWLAWTPRGLFI